MLAEADPMDLTPPVYKFTRLIITISRLSLGEREDLNGSIRSRGRFR